MQETRERRAAYADLEAVPPHLVAELIRGRLVTHPRPTGRHSRSHCGLASILGPPFDEGVDGPGGWMFLTEPELHLDGDVCVPELAGWRVERVPPPPAPDPLAPVQNTLGPDWVCEILSPKTEAYDRGEKREIYAEAGIGHLWLIDVRLKVIEAFALADGGWRLARTCRGEVPVRMPPFDAIEIALAGIWPPRREAEPRPEER